MYTVKIMNEYLHSPIWIYDEEDWIVEGATLFDNDKEIHALSEKIERLYSSYFHFGSDKGSVWFDDSQEKEDSKIMLELIGQLKVRLDELNDGTYTVLDVETNRLQNL